jgi:hypothetical protein
MTGNALRNRRLAQRHLFYFKIGWSMYLWYVFDFMSSLTIIYFLLLGSIPGTAIIFPDIWRFGVAALLSIFLLSDIVGWLHFHNLGTYAAEQDITAESSPFTTEMVTKSLLPFCRLTYEVSKVMGLDQHQDLNATMKEAERILKRSEERWAEKSKKK